MRLRWVAIGWVGAAAIGAGAWQLGGGSPFRTLPSTAAMHARHLEAQRLDDATLAFDLELDPLELRGRLRGELELPPGASELRFVAPDHVVVAAATLAGAALSESRDTLAEWLARPGDLRALVGPGGGALASGPFLVEFRLPLRRRGDGVLFEGDLAALLRVGEAPGLGSCTLGERIEWSGAGVDEARRGGLAPARLATRILDPFQLLPRAPRTAARPPACTFAHDERTGALAVGVRRDAAPGGPGVLLFTAIDARGGDTRWFRLPDAPRRLAFAARAAALVVELERGDALLLDLASGTARLLAEELLASAATGHVLEVALRAPGSYVQRLHDLSAPRVARVRVPGLRRVDFVQGDAFLVRAASDGRAECLAYDGTRAATLPCARGSCRAVLALPFCWCALEDTGGGSRLLFAEREGGDPWRLDLPLHVTAIQPAADGAELLLFAEAPAAAAGADGSARYHVLRVATLPGERPARVWSGSLQPLAVPGSNGLLFAGPVRGDALGPRALAFATFVALAADEAAAPRPIGLDARLETLPAFAARGRYLYYLRAPEGTLWRHDFLTGRDGPLELAQH